MLQIRHFLFCLLMLTVSFQGFAATAMIMCANTPSHHTPAAQTATHHGSANHEHAVSGNGSHSDSKNLPDSGHKCGVCAACCSPAVTSSAVDVAVVNSLASAVLVDASVSHYAVHPRQPEKPPRA